MKIMCILTSLFVPTYIQAETHSKIIDLSSNDTIITESVKSGNYSLTIINKAPAASYSTEIQHEFFEQNTLPSPTSVVSPKISETEAVKDVVAKMNDMSNEQQSTCTKLIQATAELTRIQDEKSVQAAKLAINNELDSKECQKINVVEKAGEVLRRTEQTLTFDIAEGQKTIIKIKRITPETQTWSYTAKSDFEGKWEASWSLVVLKNQDENFFSKQNGEKYTVTKKDDDDEYDLVPAVFYTYLLYRNRSGWTNGPTVGLGLDDSNFALFTGYNFTYNSSVGLSFGVALHKQNRLLGEYSEGQELSENVQKLTEERYDTNGFVALNFKF